MLKAHHLIVGAVGRTRLVHSDGDRLDAIRRVHDEFGAGLLAFSILDTHFHFVAEGNDVGERLGRVMRAYGQSFLRRYGIAGPLLRGPVTDVPIRTIEQLSCAIHYVHNNPVKAGITKKQLEHEWSTTRNYVGFSLTPWPNVARAELLLGPSIKAVVKARPELVTLERMAEPIPSTKLIVAAAAQAIGVTVDEIVKGVRSSDVKRARNVVVALAQLEQFSLEDIAQALELSRNRIWQLRKVAVAAHDLRVVRTLLRKPGFRARLIRDEEPPLMIDAEMLAALAQGYDPDLEAETTQAPAAQAPAALPAPTSPS